jgi:adenosylcobinamide-phosphate synthase
VLGVLISSSVLVVSLAVALDLVFGEPPSRLHPVVWMGNMLKFLRSTWRSNSPRGQFLEGAGCWILGAVVVLAVVLAVMLAVVMGLVGLLSSAVQKLPISLEWLEVPLSAVLLKPLFSIRSLFAAVRAVQLPLEGLDLPEARKMLSWHLVSRNTHELPTDQVAGAAIESLFENLSDSIIAPILCFVIGGLPLAALYRFANTADAMWGYRTPPLEYPGKWAAHADDVLNLIPARVTGCCIALASFTLEGWKVMLRDGLKTASPNAGIPMSAGAGALGIRLEKHGVYALNENARAPQPSDLAPALNLAKAALGVFFGIFFGIFFGNYSAIQIWVQNDKISSHTIFIPLLQSRGGSFLVVQTKKQGGKHAG